MLLESWLGLCCRVGKGLCSWLDAVSLSLGRAQVKQTASPLVLWKQGDCIPGLVKVAQGNRGGSQGLGHWVIVVGHPCRILQYLIWAMED